MNASRKIRHNMWWNLEYTEYSNWDTVVLYYIKTAQLEELAIKWPDNFCISFWKYYTSVGNWHPHRFWMYNARAFGIFKWGNWDLSVRNNNIKKSTLIESIKNSRISKKSVLDLVFASPQIMLEDSLPLYSRTIYHSNLKLTEHFFRLLLLEVLEALVEGHSNPNNAWIQYRLLFMGHPSRLFFNGVKPLS